MKMLRRVKRRSLTATCTQYEIREDNIGDELTPDVVRMRGYVHEGALLCSYELPL